MSLLKATLLSLAAAAVKAQDNSGFAFDCDDFDLDAGEDYPTVSIQAIQQPDPSCEDGCECASTYADQIVKVEGVVTAIGGTTNAVSNEWFWIQDPSPACKTPTDDEACAYGGLQVLEQKHDLIEDLVPGVVVEIWGKITESFSVTIIDACLLITKSIDENPAANVPAPVPVTGSMFQDQDLDTYCTDEGEKYEGMLVEFKNVEVLPCIGDYGNTADDCKDNFIPGEVGPDAQVWDKFQQFWLQTEDGFVIEVDDHLVQLYTQCETKVGTKWESLVGIVTFSFGSWDIVPRSGSDVMPCDPVTYEDLAPAKISEGNPDADKTPILQLSQKYSNTLDDNDGEYFTPLEQLGCDQFNSNGEEGRGGYNGTPGESPCYFYGNSCPGVAIGEPFWAGVKTHSACGCYPPYFYNPGPAQSELGSISANGVGTRFVDVTAIVSYVQQADGPFYIEDSCEPDSAIYVFRSGPVKVAVGDEIRIIGTTYVYYGLPEIQDVIDLQIISKGNSICPSKVITDLSAFSKNSVHGACDDVGAALVSNNVRIENVKVKTIFKDLEKEDAELIASTDGSFGCNDGTGAGISWGYGACKVELEDAEGNTIIMDDKFGFMWPMLLGTDGLGGTSLPIEVGTEFEYIEGLIDITRGVYKGTGGRLVLCPFENAWKYPGSLPTTDVCELMGYTPKDGDVNDDGIINILDVVEAVSFVTQSNTDEDGKIACKGDVNDDDTVDILDIVSIVNIILLGSGK